MRHDIITRIHDDIRKARLIGRGVTIAPTEARRGLFKQYPRMERVPLPYIENASSLNAALEARSSQKPGGAQTLTTERLSMLLHTLRVRSNGTRPYPSGGGLYPIETYVITPLTKEPEVFHYHPGSHVLERLWTLPPHLTLSDLYNAEEQSHAANALLVFTAVWERSACRYGDFAYQLALLEAGHMAQNVLLAAAAQHIAARPIAGFSDRMVQDALDLDGVEEQPVYTILFD